jgi:hypothetical protein
VLLALLVGLPHATPHAVDEHGVVWQEARPGVWLRGCTGWGTDSGFVFLRPDFAAAWPPLRLGSYLEQLHGRRNGSNDLTGPERSEGPSVAPLTHTLDPRENVVLACTPDTHPANRHFFASAEALPAAERVSVASRGAVLSQRRRMEPLAEPLVVRLFGACRRVRGVW